MREPISKVMSNFRIINLPSAGRDVLKEEGKLPGYLRLETCARLLFLGLEDESQFKSRPSILSLANVPSEGRSKEFTLCGKDAYAYLLRVAAGLESHNNAGESFVLGRFRQRWDALKSQGAVPKTLGSLMNTHFFSDVRTVRSDFVQNVGVLTYAKSALTLLAPKPDDRIVVLGGTFEQIVDLIYAAARPTSGIGGNLIIYGASEDLQSRLVKRIAEQVAGKRLLADKVSFAGDMSLSDFSKLNPEHAVVLSNIAGQSMAELTSFRSTTTKLNVLATTSSVTLQGKYGASSQKVNTIKFSDLHQAFLAESKKRDTILSMAHLACELCAKARTEGEKPNWANIKRACEKAFATTK